MNNDGTANYSEIASGGGVSTGNSYFELFDQATDGTFSMSFLLAGRWPSTRATYQPLGQPTPDQQSAQGGTHESLTSPLDSIEFDLAIPSTDLQVDATVYGRDI
jgi:hypothetical protein